jgi:hypothetical protein
MDDLTRTFLLKAAQQAPQAAAPQAPQAAAPQAPQAAAQPTPYNLRINAPDVDIAKIQPFVDQTGEDFKYWGGRLENDQSFDLFERLNPERAGRVRAMGGLAREVALNPNRPLQVNATIDLGQRGWGDKFRSGVNQLGILPGGQPMNEATGTAMVDRLKAQALDPNSPAMKYYKDLGARNYLSNTVQGWTSGLGGFAQPANRFMQWLLSMISKVPGFSSLLSRFTHAESGSGPIQNISFGAPKILANDQPFKLGSARVSPYSHYRRVATMPNGAEVLERWNRN